MIRPYLLCATILLFTVMPMTGYAEAQTARDTTPLLDRVAQAVEDEIYDLRHERMYFQIDGNSGGDNTPAKISLYVSKTLSPKGAGVAIYKDMPYGEVYRYFSVGENGLVTLSGEPDSKFPPTGGSMLTIYMADEQVADFITNKSYRTTFVVDPNVNAKRLREAEERQISRVGFSFRRQSSHKLRK